MSWELVSTLCRVHPWPKGNGHTGDAKTLRVLWFLAVLADDNHECYPSQETIARDIGVSRRDVQHALRSLSDQGWIKKVKPHKARKRGTTYRLLFAPDDFPPLEGESPTYELPPQQASWPPEDDGEDGFSLW